MPRVVRQSRWRAAVLGRRDSETGEPITWGTLEELHASLQEVLQMLLEDGEPRLEAEFVGTQSVVV